MSDKLWFVEMQKDTRQTEKFVGHGSNPK